MEITHATLHTLLRALSLFLQTLSLSVLLQQVFVFSLIYTVDLFIPGSHLSSVCPGQHGCLSLCEAPAGRRPQLSCVFFNLIPLNKIKNVYFCISEKVNAILSLVLKLYRQWLC